MRLLLIALVSVLFLAYHYYLGSAVPFVWPDEVLFFNPAFEWYEYGILRTGVLEGLIPGMESATLWMPPLYLLVLGTSFHFWDPNLENARILSSLFGLLGGLVIVFWIGKIRKTDKRLSRNNLYLVLAFLYFSMDILFIKVSHTSRMETLCALLGILGILTAYNRYSLVSGLFLGLSFLAHPFGAFYGIPVLYLHFVNDSNPERNLAVMFGLARKPILLLGLGGMIPISFWLAYLIPNWDMFLLQFGAQISRKRELFETFGYLDKLKIFLSGYFQPMVRLPVLIALLGFSLFLIRDPLYRKIYKLTMVWYMAMLIGFLGSTESWYVVHSTYPLFFLFYLVSVSLVGTRLRFLFFSIVLGYQVLSLLWFQYSLAIQEDSVAKKQIFMEEVSRQVAGKDSVYVQLIPEPYFHLREKFPSLKYYAFIPGELPIPEEYYLPTLEKIDMFLFFDDTLMNRALIPLLSDSQKYKKSTTSIPYKSRVPGKGPWKIISYEKINP